MKFKPKLKQRITAFFLAITTAITALPTNALAAVYTGAGDGVIQSPASAGDFTYGLDDTYAINSWRVTLYVSTSDDGKIDPDKDSISGTGLGKVGTIFYNNIFSVTPNSDVFVQLVANTDTRSVNLDTEISNLSKIKSDDTYISGSDVTKYGGEKTFVMSGATMSEWLPIYGAYTNAPSGDEDFTQRVIEDMNECLGGSSGNFDYIYKKVLSVGACKTGTNAGDKLDKYLEKAEKNEITYADALSILLPTNDDCVVEWCCVVEPLVERRTLMPGALWFARVYDDQLHTCFLSCIVQNETDPSQVLLLDAYETAKYNESTRKLFSKDDKLTTLDDAFKELISQVTDILGKITRSHGDPETGTGTTCEVDWGNHGQLLSEYGSILLNHSATVCYDTHEGYEKKTYCGVPVAGSIGASLSYGIKGTGADAIALAAKTAAQYGGIAVLTTQIEDNKTPVYYYIYDENNNFLRKETKSYTQNETHTFQPSDEYGIPIAMESTSRGDKRYCEFYTIIRDLFAGILFIQYLAKQNTLW